MDEEEKQESTSQVETQTSGEKSKPSAMVIGTVVVVIVILAAGYTLIKGNKSSTGEESIEAQNGTQEESLIPPSGDTQENQSRPESMVQKQIPTQTITVEGGMFYFKPSEIKVKKGETVKITLTSKEGSHDFVIDKLNVSSSRISSDNSTTVEITPDRTGSFQFYCSVSNHKQMGMIGTLIVE